MDFWDSATWNAAVAPKSKSLAHYNKLVTCCRLNHPIRGAKRGACGQSHPRPTTMEVYHWFLLGIMLALIPCSVVMALMVWRVNHRESDANSSDSLAVDRAAYDRQQAEMLTRISQTRPVRDFTGRFDHKPENGFMDDHEIKQAIYGLLVISSVFAAALAAGI